jgi:N-acetylmuramoyl-L-alanine amidase
MPIWKGIVARGFTSEDFAAYVAGLSFANWMPSFCVVHNTQDPTFAQWHDVPGRSRMRGLESYYRDDRGWSGGPHLFVADDLIWCFTPLVLPGVHSPSWNDVAWGVELVGDYEQEVFSDEVKANACEALATLHRAAGWTEPKIRFHKEDPATTHTGCPGKNVVKAEIEAGVQTLLDLNR